MKVSAWLILSVSLSAQLLIANTGRGQSSLDKKITLELRDESLRTALNTIGKISGLRMAYPLEQVSRYKHINLAKDTRPIEQILSMILANTGLAFRQDANTILIFKKELAALPIPDAGISGDPLDIKPLARPVTGTVRDDKGNPVSGASVIVQNSSLGTSTNTEGAFSINLPDNADSLVISAVGFEEFHISTAGKTKIAITLARQDKNNMNEVVVVGYGSQKKATLTGAVSTVSGRTLTDLPVSNLSTALAGRVPGMTVVSSATVPGAAASITIRGLGTFNNTQALYVVDGIVRDQSGMDGLDPNEVESVSVLKDAASAAVYGSRASNGVILVTTKRGSSQKPVVNYKASVGSESPTRTVKLLNAYQNTQFNNDAIYAMDGYDLTAAQNDPRYFTPDEVDYFKTHSYNYLKDLTKNGLLDQHNLSVNGGSDNIKYFMSAGYFDEKGNFSNLGYKRYNIRSNVDAKISKDLTVSLTMDGNIKKSDRPWWTYDFNYGLNALPDLYHGIQQSSPYFPMYINGKPVGNAANGNFNTWHPGEVMNDEGYIRGNQKTYNGIIALEYKVPFISGLKIKGSYSYNYNSAVNKTLYKPYTVYDFATTGDHSHIVTDNIIGSHVISQQAYSSLSEDMGETNSYQLDLYLNYDKDFGRHHISATAVYEQSEGTYNYFNGQKQDLLTPAIDQLYIASSDPNLTSFYGNASETGRLSYVGRLNYDYAGKYIIETAFRYDGSLIFPPGKRWGFFPSAAAAWRMSEESFFKNNINWVSNLKLRGSVGLLGNDAVNPFQYEESYSVGSGPIFGSATNAIYSSVYPNPNITWERTRSVNLGLDAGFLSNALSVQIDYFTRHTYDMLLARQKTVPATFGFTLPYENYGVVDVKGWEASAGYNGHPGKDFSYSIRANVGYSKSKVTKIDVSAGTPSYLSPIGRPLNLITGYVNTGIIRTAADQGKKLTLQGYPTDLGTLSYADLYGPNGAAPDGIVNGNDQVILSDKADPRYNYGLTLGGSWKNFSVDIFFQGIGGWDKLITNDGTYAFWSNHWTPTNTNAAFPRAFYADGTNVPSSFWLRDASFLRLKNANISYTLPKQLLGHGPISNVRFFFTGTNLFLLFDKMKYMDPEASSLGYYPIMKNFTGGINVSF
jgi:TonB-linked SusC/RagA family outer membrane protein